MIFQMSTGVADIYERIQLQENKLITKIHFLIVQVKGTCQYLGVVLLVFFCLQQMKEATDGAKLRRADTVKSTPVRFPTWKVKKS